MNNAIFDPLLGELRTSDVANITERIRGGGGGAPGAVFISDEAYSSTWNGVTNIAPSKNAVYDQMETRQKKVFAVVGPTGDIGLITDGTADDVQIQSALDAAAGGGTVWLQPGLTFNLSAKLVVDDDTTFVLNGSTLKMNDAADLTVMGNVDTTNGNEKIRIFDGVVDQNGANQTSAGIGASFTGLRDSLISNVTFKKAWDSNLFVSSIPGTALTGTLTFTNGDTTVSGSGTAFTTELEVGSIIKSDGGHFQRVASIASNTSLELDRQWGWTTEAGVAARVVPANSGNTIVNCTFEGTIDASGSLKDNVGLGLFDDSYIGNCRSFDSLGYGFGPDHTNRLKLVGNVSYNNTNAGFGMETSAYCVATGNEAYGNSNGFYLLSGSYKNTITGNVLWKNGNNINVSYNSTDYPTPDDNSIHGNFCELATTHNIRVGGGSRTSIVGNRCLNALGGSGIAVATENSVVPDATFIASNYCDDTQDVHTQQRGIYIVNGTNTLLRGNYAPPANHTTAGITDSGTGTRGIGEVLDINGNIVISNTPTASAVSYVNVTNAASGGTVILGSAASTGTPNFVIRGTGIFALRPASNGANAVRIQDSAGTGNVLVADTTNIRIGIGKTSPTVALDVNGAGAFSSDVTVPDEAYGAGWNSSLEVPTKNALYDKIETISAGSGISEELAIAYATAL